MRLAWSIKEMFINDLCNPFIDIASSVFQIDKKKPVLSIIQEFFVVVHCTGEKCGSPLAIQYKYSNDERNYISLESCSNF